MATRQRYRGCTVRVCIGHFNTLPLYSSRIVLVAFQIFYIIIVFIKTRVQIKSKVQLTTKQLIVIIIADITLFHTNIICTHLTKQRKGDYVVNSSGRCYIMNRDISVAVSLAIADVDANISMENFSSWTLRST
ncbi:hypothetical protein BDC45DRAFT_535553 [Circinella umbellata]|nr:hypothetical protein BDC45DRAFT_535553 [Circinella umbellata]